ncbi:MAG: chitobiase/beta-hexosaminidase C-terminal domain-containing protein [bacterium]
MRRVISLVCFVSVMMLGQSAFAAAEYAGDSNSSSDYYAAYVGGSKSTTSSCGPIMPSSTIVKWFEIDGMPYSSYTEWFVTTSGGTAIDTDNLFGYYDAQVGIKFTTTGTYTIRAEVYSSSSKTTWLQAHRFTVTVQYHYPTVSRVSPSSPVSIIAGQSVTFSARGQDAAGDMGDVYWKLDGVMVSDPLDTWKSSDRTESYTRTFPTPGTYTMTCYFADDSGGTANAGSVSWTVTVARHPPAVHRESPSSSAASVFVNVSQTLTVHATDAGGDLQKVEWYIDGSYHDYDDVGFSGSDDMSSHDISWASAGSHTVMAKVFDDLGDTVSVTWTVTVRALGSLYGTVKNSNSIPLPNAFVIRYPSTWGTFIDTRTADANGFVKWEEVDSGMYCFEFYDKSDVATREFWGYEDNWSVPLGGSPAIKTFNRREPIITSFKVFDGSAEIAAGGSIAQGKALKVQVTARNESQVDRNVQVIVWFATNAQGTDEQSINLGTQTLGNLLFKEKTFEGFFTPPKTGTYYYRAEVKTLVNSNYIKTDSRNYGSAVFTVTAPPEAVVTIKGTPSQFQAGKRYTVTAEYNLNEFEQLSLKPDLIHLKMINPNDSANPVVLSASLFGGMVTQIGWSPTSFVTLYDVTVNYTSSKCIAEYTFSLLGKWQRLTSSGIKFGTLCYTKDSVKDNWLWKQTTCGFSVLNMPSNKWTVITHGKADWEGGVPVFQSPFGSGPDFWRETATALFDEFTRPSGWMLDMALRMEAVQKTPYRIHRVNHSTFTTEYWNGVEYISDTDETIADSLCHHVLLFDWICPSDYIDAIPPRPESNWFAYASGDALYALLCKMNIASRVNTLVGYSRGAVVMSEAACRLLKQGVNNFQVIYLDGEGWRYQDSEVHGWKNTRTDQYRSESGEYIGGALMLWCGGDALPLTDNGNDRIVDLWPMGPSKGSEIGHSNYPRYFSESLYIATDSLVGMCYETPEFWDDDELGTKYNSYPTKGAEDRPGFYNGGFLDESAAGWSYHGGYADFQYDEIEVHGCLHLAWSETTMYKHNWMRVPENVTDIAFRYDLGNFLSTAGQFCVRWNDQEVALIPFGEGTLWESACYRLDVSAGSVGRIEVLGQDMPLLGGAFVDDFEFIVNTSPTIGSLVPDPVAVVEGGLVNLAAINVSDTDGTVQSVEFWHVIPSGGEERVDVNTIGAPPGGTWYSNIRVSGYEHAQHTFKVRAKDNKGSWSPWATCVVTVTASPNQPPVIGSFNASSLSVDRGENVTLTAQSVTDDVQVARVKNYRDNGDGLFNAGTDTELGNGIANGTTYTLLVSTTGYPVGNVRFWAVAYDNLDVPSVPLSRVVEIKQLWTLAYTVIPSTTAGTITPNPAAGSLPHGTTVNPSAAPKANWYLHHWEANNQSVNLPFSLTANTTVSAVFSQIVNQAQSPVITDIADHSTPFGSPYSRTPQLTQGYPAPTWVPVGGFPSGMVIDPVTGTVSWPNPQPVDQSFVITICATNASGSDDETWTLRVAAAGMVDQPQFSYGSGIYSDAIDVTVTCATPGATIRYTIDGGMPTTNHTVVANGGKIRIQSTTQLKARAWKDGWIESLQTEAIYTLPSTRISIFNPPDLTATEVTTTRVDIAASSIEGLSRVDWLRNGALVGTTNFAASVNVWSNSFILSGLVYGTNVLTAIALDQVGGTTTSTPVRVSLHHRPVITEGDSVGKSVSQDGSPTIFALTLHATEPDGDTVTWRIKTLPLHGTASVSGLGFAASVAYQPETAYFGADSFIVQADDGRGLTDEITVNVTIIRVWPLTVTTPYGSAVPPTGTNRYNTGTSLSGGIINSPVDNGTIQYMCRGWTGTGSVPSTGITTNTPSFSIITNSTISWLWRTNYWLNAEANGNGSVNVGDGWRANGTNVQITAMANPHYHFVQWTGQTNGCVIDRNVITVPMTMAREIMADFGIDQHRLIVQSKYGGAVPPVGTNWYNYNSLLTAVVTNSPVMNGTTQYVCTAWSGSGSLPASGGITNTGPFVLTNDTLVAWQWTTNFWLDAGTSGNGGVSVPDGFFPKGTNVQITAIPSAHYHLSGWSGQTNGCTSSGNVITVPMTIPRAITANFALDQHSLIVTTPFGKASPASGTNWYNWGSGFTAALTNSPFLNGTTQYVCKGWAGTGSVPVSGLTTNTGLLTLTNNSTIAWQWTTNFWLNVATNGSGAVDAANGWCPSGTNMTVTATAGASWRFTGWAGQTNGCIVNGNTLKVLMDRARPSITANFVRQYQLVVATPYGGGVPPEGTNWRDTGTSVIAVITNSPYVNGTIQYVCRGWVGTGNVPASGITTNTAVFSMTADSTVTWLWRTNYWLDVGYTGMGSLSTNDSWVAKDASVQVTATPSAYSVFSGWTGDTNGCVIAGNKITVAMYGPREIIAVFLTPQYQFQVVSPYGLTTPISGTNWLYAGSSVRAAVVNSPVIDGTTQYVCRGWVGTGNMPASGPTTNTATVTVTTNSTITWLWRTNYWLDVNYTGQGRLSTNDGWFAKGTNVLITATASNHWHFSGWSGQTAGCVIDSNKITVLMDGSRAITSAFEIDRHKLIVTTPYGIVWPEKGTNWFDYGSTNYVAVTNAPIMIGETQYFCKGWAGTGSAPTSGITTNTGLFKLTNDSTIVWSWQTNYWMNTGVEGGGTVNVGDGWLVRGTNVQVIATASNFWYFGNWRGTTNGCTITNNKITVAMSGPRQVTAVLKPYLATNNVPKWWLFQYGLNNFNSDAMRDIDGDGHMAWQEYVTGSNPTNRESVFRSLIFISNGLPCVTWTPDLGAERVYTVEGKTNLTSSSWGPTNGGSRYFRVRVDMP